MTKTLLSIAVWAVLGWLAGAWISADLGWIVFTLGLIIMIVISGIQHSRIARWVMDIDSPPPPSVGPWDDILAPIYRKLRRNRQEIDTLALNLDRIMLAAEALPDGAITLDQDMAVTWCNQTASHHIGLNLDIDRSHSIFHILRDPEFARYARQASWPGPLLLHYGPEKSLLVQLNQYGTQRYLLVTRDVTQIEKLETTRKDFVANVSHELRTPLTVLSGFLETLRDTPRDAITPEQEERYRDLMIEQAHRMQAIVDDLLILSTLESSPGAEGEAVQMSAVIRTALQQAKVLSDDKHTFIEDVADDLCIIGAENELASATSNLLTNAVRYTPAGGTITVGWHRGENGGARLSVRDTGIGIASHDIPRLTERFFRVDRGRSRAAGATGLGLAITKHVALRHNAELTIQSRLGAGSVFALEFPAARITQCDQTH